MGKKVEKQLGKRVAKLRTAAGLTQAELPENVGVATETISPLERGATVPSVSRLDDVAQALGLGIWNLFEPDARVPPGQERRPFGARGRPQATNPAADRAGSRSGEGRSQVCVDTGQRAVPATHSL